MKHIIEKEKTIQKKYRITLVLYGILIILFFALYILYQKSIFTALILFVIFVGSIVSSVFEFQLITLQAKSMWYEYSNNQSLISGIGFVVVVFLVPLALLLVLSKCAPSDWKEIINSLITSLIALLPALLSLLGIHYSLTMQEIAKRKEVQSLNKPYITLKCLSELVVGHHPITAIKADFIIENLANNILIPLYIQYGDEKFLLQYRPITLDKPGKYDSVIIDLKEQIENTLIEFSIIYKDSLGNVYKSNFNIDLNNRENRYLNLNEPKQIIVEEQKENNND